jgi:hypothetical protein
MSKSEEPTVAIVGTSKLLSKKRFRISQLVSAISRQPWQAAPCVARRAGLGLISGSQQYPVPSPAQACRLILAGGGLLGFAGAQGTLGGLVGTAAARHDRVVRYSKP